MRIYLFVFFFYICQALDERELQFLSESTNTWKLPYFDLLSGSDNSNCSLWSDITCVDNHITGLNFQQKGLEGEIIQSIQSLTYLQEIYLFSNNLTGPIPSSLSNLTNLKSIFISNNQLSGTIPKFSATLEVFIAHSNNFSGPIPEIPSSLSVCDVEENSFIDCPAPTICLRSCDENCQHGDSCVEQKCTSGGAICLTCKDEYTLTDNNCVLEEGLGTGAYIVIGIIAFWLVAASIYRIAN